MSTQLVQQAVEAALRMANYTREEAYVKGLVNTAVALDVRLLEETAKSGKAQEDRERAKRTIEKILWHGGRKYTYKPEEVKVAA